MDFLDFKKGTKPPSHTSVKAYGKLQGLNPATSRNIYMAMVSSRLLFFLSAILILIVQALAWPPFLYHSCLNTGNHTNNSTYETNLNQLLSSLYSNTEIDYGFYNSSYGQNSDDVYAIGLCRGDVKPDVCRIVASKTLRTFSYGSVPIKRRQ